MGWEGRCVWRDCSRTIINYGSTECLPCQVLSFEVYSNAERYCSFVRIVERSSWIVLGPKAGDTSRFPIGVEDAVIRNGTENLVSYYIQGIEPPLAGVERESPSVDVFPDIFDSEDFLFEFGRNQ